MYYDLIYVKELNERLKKTFQVVSSLSLGDWTSHSSNLKLKIKSNFSNPL